MSSLVLLFAVFLAQGGPAEAFPAGPEKAAESPPSGKDSSARPADTIASLLEGDRGPEPLGARAEGMDFRLLGWVAVVAILGFWAVRIGRRVRVRGGAGLEGGGLRVVSRAALTPRHSVYAVRVGTQRLLVVGVSRERIVPLLEMDDPTRWMALDQGCGTALEGQDEPTCGRKENEHGEGNRNDGSLAAGDPFGGRRSLGERREVRRLSALFRGFRGKKGRALERELGPK